MREHAIADVDDIGGTGTEIFIFGSAIAFYLHVECQAPGMVGSDPHRDDLICLNRQRIIFKHGDLEFQNVGHIALIVLICSAISALAPSIAARSAAASCAGSSLAVRLATAAVSMVTGPIARPGEAARPMR